MSKFSFLRILDEDGFVVVNHVGNDSYSIYIDDAAHYGLPNQSWRKLYHLTNWIEANKPNWQIIYKEIEYDKLMSL